VVEAKKPLVILAILVAGLILFGLTDTAVSIADTGTSNQVTNNYSASTTITITMYVVAK